MGAVHHAALLAGVDEQYFAAPVAELAVAPVTGEEPQAGRNLGGIEKLARQRHHTVHLVRLNEDFSDLALTRLARRHRAVGEHEAGYAARR